MKNFLVMIVISIFSVNITFAESILKLSEVRPGMNGVGYTVIENSRIDSFNVEVLKVIKGQNGIKNMILGRVSGNPIKLSGGISEGMSGSPIYVNGRIIGALAYTLDSDNKTIGVITPIEEMLKVSEDNKLEFARVTSNIRPGSAIAISPVRGDISFDNLGTLTLIKGSRFFALGHPIEGRGAMKYFLNEAKIDYSVPSKENPYKMGYSLRTIGLVTQDRRAGVSGILTQDIKTYEFFTEVQSDRGTEKFNFEMPKDNLTLKFYLAKAYEFLFKNNYDADEYKSMEYSYKILDDNKNVIYENGNFIYFEDSLFENYSGIIGDEIMNIIDNPFKNISFKRVEMKLTLSREKRVAYIKKISLAKDVIRIGDKIKINLSYLIHQRGIVNTVVDFEVPKDFKLGAAKIEIFAGESSRADEEGEPANYNYKSLNEFLKYYKSKYKNNELIIKLESDDGQRYIIKRAQLKYALVLKDDFSEDIIIDSMPANEVKNESTN